MGDPTTPFEHKSSKLPENLSMEFETVRIPISTTILSDPDKLKKFTQFVKDIEKLCEVQHSNLCNFKAMYFEGPQSQYLGSITGGSPSDISSETEQAPDSGTLQTYLCLSKEKYQFVPLPKWLEDRKYISLHEIQINDILLQVASGIDKLVEKGLSLFVSSLCLSDVHVVVQKPGNRIAPHFMPSVKLSCVPSAYLVEGALELVDLQESSKVENFVAKVFEKLTENLETTEKVKFIEEEILKGNLSNLMEHLKDLQAPAKTGLLFNVGLPCKQFFGRFDLELKTLMGSCTTFEAPDSGPDIKMIIIQGKSGSGKSELIAQLCAKLIGYSQLKLNIIILNCESSDSLTASLYQLCEEVGIQISDFTGNCRLLRDIFRELLFKGFTRSAEDKQDKTISLAIFENLMKGNEDGLSEEILDLVQIFNENREKFSKLILVTRQLQSLECPVFSDKSSMITLTLSEVLVGEDTCEVDKLYDKLEDVKDKMLLDKLLMVVGFMDGNFGMMEDKLGQLIGEIVGDSLIKISNLLKDLTSLSIVTSLDGVIRVTSKVQGEVVEILKRRNLCVDKLLEAYQSCLSSELLSHASKTWMGLMAFENDKLIKKWSKFPEVVGILAKSSNKLETVTEFLRKSIQLLIKAYQEEDPDNIEVLKLKMLLARYSLVPLGKVNEAVGIFKGVAEQCGPSPRGAQLGVKLRALLELAKVHMKKGSEIDKALMCLQNVQVLASQKLATFEVDSDPNLLECRVLLGRAHYLNNNLGESKRMILEVIPLVSRKAKKEEEDKVLINQAKFILGSIFRKTGDLVNALMLETRVVEERESKLFGKGHPESWVAKLELSYLYSEYDNHDKALSLLRELLEDQERILGAPNNLWSLKTMKAIAEGEGKRGNWEEALELWEAIDLILEEVKDGEGEELEGIKMECQLSQAEVLMNLGQYKEAGDLLDLVFTLKMTSKKKISGGDDDDKLKGILRRREKCEKSLDIMAGYWLSLSESLEDNFGGGGDKLEALAKKHEAAVQLSDENQDHWGALRLLREILEEMEAGLEGVEENNKFYLNVKADLARVLGLVGKFNESFSVYKEIIPVMEAEFGETDEGTMLCKDNMGQVFLYSGNQFLKRQMSNLKW